ncbi:MAG: hypothetical protein LE178_01170 [Endomicrobium sp.]|nr:hypothetical protein [Endomicrobium sp.]
MEQRIPMLVIRIFNFLTGVGIEWLVLDNLSLSAEAGFKFETGNGITSFSTDVNAIPSISVKFYS